MGLEVVVVGGARVVGLGKMGTVALVVVEGSGFTVGVVAGLAKKLGTVGCAGAGTVEDVGAGVGIANGFFGGSLVSVVNVVVPGVGFGCVGATETGVNKVGVVMVVVEVVVAGLSEIAGFLSSVTF